MNEPHNNTSLTLIARARSNEPDAWLRLVQLYGPLVYSWARAADLQPGQVTDVAQDIFRAVRDELDDLPSDPGPVGSFRSWLWGITRRTIIEHAQLAVQPRNGTDRPQPLAPEVHRLLHDEEQPPVMAGAEPRTLLITAAIRIIKAESESNTWDAFWRMTVHGETAATIASDLGMPVRAVRQARYRVSRKLRELLAADLQELSLAETEALT